MPHAGPTHLTKWRLPPTVVNVAGWLLIIFALAVVLVVVAGLFPSSILVPAEWLLLVAFFACLALALRYFLNVVRGRVVPPLEGISFTWWIPLGLTVIAYTTLNDSNDRSWRVQAIDYCFAAGLMVLAAAVVWGRLAERRAKVERPNVLAGSGQDMR